MTDRPTDHANQSVTVGHIYVRSSAMWPNDIVVNEGGGVVRLTV